VLDVGAVEGGCFSAALSVFSVARGAFSRVEFGPGATCLCAGFEGIGAEGSLCGCVSEEASVGSPRCCGENETTQRLYEAHVQNLLLVKQAVSRAAKLCDLVRYAEAQEEADTRFGESDTGR